MRRSVPAWAVVMTALLLGFSAAGYRDRPPPTPVDLDAYPWLYLRGGEPPGAGEMPVVVIAVGDITRGQEGDIVPDPFDRVAPWLRQADLTLGNLEGIPVAESAKAAGASGFPAREPIRLTLPVRAVPMLGAAGFDLLGLANNHALDGGPAALEEGARLVQQAGLTPLGAGSDLAAAWQPVIRTVRGVELAFLAVNALPESLQERDGEAWTLANWDRDLASEAVAAARQTADAVIISVHWGYENQARIDPLQRELAEALVQAGADLVVGHHPHMVQGTSVLPASRRAPSTAAALVAFSLGNFVFDRYDGGARWGLALRVFFDDQGLRAVQALPVWAGARPSLIPPETAETLLAPILPPPGILGYRCPKGICQPIQAPQAALGGLFWTGEVDLTGDGRPEQVHRWGAGVTISVDGEQVWGSPPDWRVLDAALGDPNDDGRQELLLALEKPDAAGEIRSHPFLVGFRGGMYRVLWGGSAVTDPILEVELGDVTGDGNEELVVLEAYGAASNQTLSVWRWHGWGYALLWRGPPGRFQDLTLVEGQPGSLATILVARPWHAFGK